MVEEKKTPNCWEKRKIENVAPLQRGFDLPIKALKKGFYPVVYSNGVGCYHINYKVEGPGVITGRSGTIGKVHYIEGNYWPHNTTLWVTDFKNNNSKYVYYVYSYMDLERFATGSGVPTLNRNDVHMFEVLFPPLPEQQAIAAALSDIDTLISSLSKLIEKKKNIKQGAMQELLTGKKRLEGFIGEWVEVKLGSICEIKKGQLITEKGIEPGEVPVIAGGKQPAYYHRHANRKGKTITISASGASAGYVSFYQEPIFASDCSTIEGNKNYDIIYIYSTLQLKQLEIYSAQTGGAQPHIHPRDLEPLRILLPSSVQEQTAIANIFSDMDAEIEALEQKLNKYKAIKQGMMQELLTGRIRLV